MNGSDLFKISRGQGRLPLKKNVSVGEFVKDNKINILVQDEIPASSDEYDYTFVWMSDTQYYSEKDPYIFDRHDAMDRMEKLLKDN